jgi:hypothetical protein
VIFLSVLFFCLGLLTNFLYNNYQYKKSSDWGNWCEVEKLSVYNGFTEIRRHYILMKRTNTSNGDIQFKKVYQKKS